MIQKSNYLVLLSFLLTNILSLNSCRTMEDINPDDVEFSEAKQERYLKMNDKGNAEFLESIRAIQEKHVSFIADFSLRIDRYSPVREKFYADGKLYFSKETGKIKIQLMDNFFGLVFSEVIAEPDSIRVKSSQDQKIHSQGMDDLGIYDPAKRKTIVIPFPVIYYSITGNFITNFTENPSYFSPSEKRVMVKKGMDEYVYFFDGERLTSLEWIAQGKGMKAVAKTGDKAGFPPVNLVTKIVEPVNEKETVLILTKLRNIRMVSPSPRIFNF